MLEDRMRQYAQARGFHPKTLTRWLDWEPQDSGALLDLATSLKIGENHLRDLMDWLEEIALRDDAKVHQILEQKALADIASDPRLGRADKLKKIKEQLRRWRFPRLSQTEDRIRGWIRELKLPPAISVSVPPGLEGGTLYVAFTAASHEELKQLSGQLAATADHAALEKIFSALAGQETTDGSELPK